MAAYLSWLPICFGPWHDFLSSFSFSYKVWSWCLSFSVFCPCIKLHWNFSGLGGPPVAFAAPVPEAEPVIAEDIQIMESARPLSAEPDGTVAKPQLELRNYFPENWLFSIENISGSCLMR